MNENDIKILLVEDDLPTRDEFREAIEEMEGYVLIGETGSESEALEILHDWKVDVMILDLELDEGSGISLLSELEKRPIEKPLIAVITNVRSQSIHNAIREFGVDYIYTKNNPQYGASSVLDIIRISTKYIHRNSTDQTNQEKNEISKERRVWKNVNSEIIRMGFSAKNMGTIYVIDAIVYMIMKGIYGVSITKMIYPVLAEKYGASTKSVEKNIRDAIERVWVHTEAEDLAKVYPYPCSSKTGRPTNSEFLNNMANKIGR